MEFKGRKVSKATIKDIYLDFIQKIESTKSFVIAKPEIVSQMMIKKGFSLSDVFDKDNAIELGKSAGAKQIVTGNVNQVGKSFFLTLNITDIASYESYTRTLKASNIDDLKKQTQYFVEQMSGVDNRDKIWDVKELFRKDLLKTKFRLLKKKVNLHLNFQGYTAKGTATISTSRICCN